MAAPVHIPLSDLPAELEALVRRALNGEDIVVDAGAAAVRLTPVRSHTAGDLIANTRFWQSAAALDDEWAADLRKIVDERKVDTADPWA